MDSKRKIRKIGDCLYDWEPGNATRYRLAIANCGESTIIAWLHRGDSGGSAFLLLTKELSTGYLAEKMNIRWPDAEAIIEFLLIQGIVQDTN